MKQIFFEIAQQKEFVIDTMETDKDHIHLLVDVKLTQSAFNIVHSLKSISTFRIYKLHRAELKKHFWTSFSGDILEILHLPIEKHSHFIGLQFHP